MSLFSRKKKEVNPPPKIIKRKVVKKVSPALSPAPANSTAGANNFKEPTSGSDIQLSGEANGNGVQVSELENLVESNNPLVVAEVNRALAIGVECIVSDKLHIYAVVKEGSSSNQGLSALASSIKKLLPPGQKLVVKKVSTRAYKTFKEKATAANRIAKTMARNEDADSLLLDAIKEGASDIHIRKRGHSADILFRVNQVLRTYEDGVRGDIVEAMIRAMWDNYRDDGDTRDDWKSHEVQDTSFPFRSGVDGNLVYMVRANCTPEKRGLKLVMRLRNTKELMPLQNMGYTDRQLKDLIDMSDMKQGVSLITGPTNSGKSTTLTTIMASIDPKWAVIEVADPIEIMLANVEHFEVSNDSDVMMKKYLKACVRQDPDYLIIGELRSQTTIDAATTMAFAGTSVMSTLHTNSVPAAIPRMLELGLNKNTVRIKGFLNGIVSQNLIPVLCDCKLPKIMDTNLSEKARDQKTGEYKELFQMEDIFFENPKGCPACKFTGIKAITLIAEVLKMNDDTRKILMNDDYNELGEYMIEEGIPTKHHHAAQKIRRGLFDPRHCESRIDRFDERNIREGKQAKA